MSAKLVHYVGLNFQQENKKAPKETEEVWCGCPPHWASAHPTALANMQHAYLSDKIRMLSSL